MGLFNFGGSRSRSQSRSSSFSFDNLDAFGFDFGFDTSQSRSRSGGRSVDRSGSRSSQSVAFEDVFANLFGDASAAAGGVNTGNITAAANMLFAGGQDIITQLQDGGTGAAFLESQISGADQIADAQVDQLGDDLQRFLAEDVRGTLTQAGVSTNTLGGSRGEVQAGIAERGASEAFIRGATDIRDRSRNRTSSLATALMQSESERSSTALAALPQMFGLMESGQMASLSPMMALSQILGPQIALTESESFGMGESSQFSEALAEALGINLGMNQTTGRAGSRSESESSSSSRSLSLGFE